MFNQWRYHLNRFWYNQQCRNIYQTPPLQIKEAPLRILSMTSHRDLTMYLVALKSLYRQIGEGTIIILNDGTLTDEDRQVMRQHLQAVEFLHIKDVNTGKCPQGGCWERLLTVIDCTKNAYIIQMDSDTLTRGAIPEVVEAYHANRGFLLGTKLGKKILPLKDAPQVIAHSTNSQHVQILAERSFDKMPNAENRKYVRASAGFAGFAKGQFSRDFVEEFSVNMTELLGPKWLQWGSEQVASNYMLANSPNAIVLPHPKYCGFYPDTDITQNVFLHFIGTYRFLKHFYNRESRRIIQEL